MEIYGVYLHAPLGNHVPCHWLPPEYQYRAATWPFRWSYGHAARSWDRLGERLIFWRTSTAAARPDDGHPPSSVGMLQDYLPKSLLI